EKLRYFHGEHHIACHFELARHKGFHGILFAFRDGNPGFPAGRKSGIRLFNSAGDKLTYAVDDLECPYSGFVPRNIPLDGFGYTGASAAINLPGIDSKSSATVIVVISFFTD